MAEENKSLSPRETAMRMLEHVHDDVSYEDIIRQLRILQQIEWVMTDVEMVGLSPESNAQEEESDLENTGSISFRDTSSALVLRSRPLFNWRSLAERSDDRSDPYVGKASWIY